MKKILLVLITFLLTGCSYVELNDLAIADALGIDYVDNKYIVSAQVMNLKKEGSDQTTGSSILYIGKGESISTAIRNISLEYPKTLYLSHLELLIIGEGVIENGIDKTFDYFLRSPETRNDALLIVCPKNKASDILNPDVNKEEEFPSKDIITTIENSMERNGKVVALNFEEFISTYLQEGISPVASSITINKEEDKKITLLTGISTFNKNKYMGNLTNNSGIAYNIINNNFYDIVLKTKYKNSPLSISVFNPKSDLNINIKNDKLTVKIDIDLEGHILETERKIKVTDKKVLEEIENNTIKDIKKYIKELIHFSKEKNTDILGIGNNIYKFNHKEYKKYKDKNLYEDTKFNINVNVKIYRYGNTHTGTIGGNYE